MTDSSGATITDSSGATITDPSGATITDPSIDIVLPPPPPPPIPEDVVSDEQRAGLVEHMKSKYTNPKDLIDMIVSGVEYVENLNLYLFQATKKTLVTESIDIVISTIDLWASAKESLKNLNDIVVGAIIDSVLENYPGRNYYDRETINYLLGKIPLQMS